jgi:hypothetical protein
MNKPVFLRTPDDQKMAASYNALNQDVGAAFTVAGRGPAWARYNKAYGDSIAEFEALEHIADAPMAHVAFDALKRGDKRAGVLLGKVRRSLDVAGLPESTWGEVVALRVTELGEPAGKHGQFSPAAWLSAFDKLDESAKRVLFIVPGKPNAIGEINRLSTLVRARQAAQPKDSGTPAGTFYNDLIRKGPGYLLSPLGIVTGYNAGKLMTNRDFSKWLADGIAQPVLTGKSRTAHLTRLIAVAANNAGLRDAVEEYWGALKGGTSFDELPDSR